MLKKTLCIFAVLSTPAVADISDEANACIDELLARYGNVGGEVLQQSGSEAGTLVRLRDGSGVEYECIVWSQLWLNSGIDRPASVDGMLNVVGVFVVVLLHWSLRLQLQ